MPICKLNLTQPLASLGKQQAALEFSWRLTLETDIYPAKVSPDPEAASDQIVCSCYSKDCYARGCEQVRTDLGITRASIIFGLDDPVGWPIS